MSEALVKCLYVPIYRPLGIDFPPKNKEHSIIYNLKKNCGFLRHVRDIVLGWFDDLNCKGINTEIDFTQFNVHCVWIYEKISLHLFQQSLNTTYPNQIKYSCGNTLNHNIISLHSICPAVQPPPRCRQGLKHKQNPTWPLLKDKFRKQKNANYELFSGHAIIGWCYGWITD